jgi:hypothetical protein
LPAFCLPSACLLPAFCLPSACLSSGACTWYQIYGRRTCTRCSTLSR